MKKQRSKKLNPKKPYKLITALAIYSLFISSFLAYGLNNLENVYSQSQGFLNMPTDTDFIKSLIVFFVIYAVRSVVVLLPKIARGWAQNGNGWVYGGIIASAPVEAILIYGVWGLATMMVCESNGELDCGWDSLGLVIFLIGSCVFQIVGMVTGTIVSGVIRKHRGVV
jgi:hypothetical protein